MAQKWTKKDIEYLKNRYGKENIEDIASALDRSIASIRGRAYMLGITRKAGAWSEDDIKFLRENYLKLGAKEIARRLERTISAVHTKIREVGGGRKSIGPRIEWTDKELKFLRENYQLMSWTELSEKLGRTEQAVQVRASLIGVKKYIDPYEFFETWTEESTYIIGFFAADGWVSKRGPESIRIAFGQKDPDVIYKIKETIGSGRISKKSNGMYQYYIQSVRAYERLCEIFGRDVCKKSRTILWPSIPDEYASHFARGAVDGDGSLMKGKDGLWRFSYATSSKDFAYSMRDEILRLTGVELNIGLNKIGVYHLRCAGIKAVCLASWLYKGSNIYLDRKEWIAREMYNTFDGQMQERSITPKMIEMFPEILNTYEIVG